jgi:hypothetical protein
MEKPIPVDRLVRVNNPYGIYPIRPCISKKRLPNGDPRTWMPCQEIGGDYMGRILRNSSL